MTYTIQQLANGEVACINDGTLEQLSLVLSKAFNCKRSVAGLNKFYVGNKNLGWHPTNRVEMPTQSVKVFLQEIEGKKLPEKWAVRCTPEIYEYLHFYAKEHLNRYYVWDRDKNSLWHFPETEFGVCTCKNLKEGYTEISFEQFCEYNSLKLPQTQEMKINTECEQIKAEKTFNELLVSALTSRQITDFKIEKTDKRGLLKVTVHAGDIYESRILDTKSADLLPILFESMVSKI